MVHERHAVMAAWVALVKMPIMVKQTGKMEPDTHLSVFNAQTGAFGVGPACEGLNEGFS